MDEREFVRAADHLSKLIFADFYFQEDADVNAVFECAAMAAFRTCEEALSVRSWLVLQSRMMSQFEELMENIVCYGDRGLRHYECF